MRSRNLPIYIVGSIIVTLWTLLRFFTHRTIFDLVSQQVIVDQWLSNQAGQASFGATHYLLKTILLHVPTGALPGDPRLKLIILTLIVNVVTYIFVGILLVKIAQLFGLVRRTYLNAGLLWLACISGSVFWIQFVNSRNIEVAGGLLLLYHGLRYLAAPTWRMLAWVVGVASLVFFSDTLQLYMTALPLLVYGLAIKWRKQRELASVGLLAAAMATGFGLSKALLAGITAWLDVMITASPAEVSSFSIGSISAAAKGTITSFAVLFSGSVELGKFVAAANLLLTIGLAIVCIITAVRRPAIRRLYLLVGCFFIIDTLVYVVSGQALAGDTSRYLIMTAPLAILALAGLHVSTLPTRWVLGVFGVVISLTIVMLCSHLIRQADTSFPRDTAARRIYLYSSEHTSDTVYASNDTAMAARYLYDRRGDAILPVGCLSGRLVRTQYAMDQSFEQAHTKLTGRIVIYLDGDTISNAPNVCTAASISAQFGQPTDEERTANGNLVLYYPRHVIRLTTD